MPSRGDTVSKDYFLKLNKSFSSADKITRSSLAAKIKNK
jgi:hypothetical protein